MRRLLIFVVSMIAVLSIMDAVHVPPNRASAADTKLAASQDAPKKENSEQKTVEPAKTEPVKAVEPAQTAAAPQPVQVPSYTRTGGCEQYRALISKYDWNVRVMMAVMEAESYNRIDRISCDNEVVGDQFPINGVYAVSCGLFQVRTIAEWRGTCDQLKNPEWNVDIAYRIYQGQGMSAWSAYTNGSYAKYLR